MGNRCSACWTSFRALDTLQERLPERIALTPAEWFSFNPFDRKIQYGELGSKHWGQSLCIVVFSRIAFLVLFIGALVLSGLGTYSGLATSGCSASDYCESKYATRINAYIHAGVYFSIAALLIWPLTWRSARYRDIVIILLLSYPVLQSWALHLDSAMSWKCDTYFHQDHCTESYNYWRLCHIMDLVYLAFAVFVLFLAVTLPENRFSKVDMYTSSKYDLSIPEHLYYKVDDEWRRPLLVKSQVVKYSDDLREWRTVVEHRNETLKAALDVATDQQNDSNTQAKLLGTYSQLISDTNDKVSKASSLLDEQHEQIGKLNDAVNDVITALGSPADVSSAGNALAMKGSDCRQWGLIAALCCLIAVGMLIGIPKWLKLFNISLGIDF